MYDASAPNIPKKIHVIWVGDEKKRPDHYISTWRDNHPSWEFRLWGNAELDRLSWRSKKQIEIFRTAGQWEGVADLMRYEILCEHGGVYADADSMCVRALDDWLLKMRMFAVWESEQHCPGLVANTYIGTIPQHPALCAIIKATSRMHSPIWRRSRRNPFRWEEILPWPDLDSRTGFRRREWQKCWRLIKPGRKCGAKL
jgi:mannosyltransferase OCH1-like enzyme